MRGLCTKYDKNERGDIGDKTISPLLLVLAAGQQSFERGGVMVTTIQNSFLQKKEKKNQRTDKREFVGYGY